MFGSAAWRELVSNNPLPAVHGRVCYHPCEDACNRKFTDSSVSIHAVERFLGDLALEKGWQFDKPRKQSGKKMLIVGAGPIGLACLEFLKLMDVNVIVMDMVRSRLDFCRENMGFDHGDAVIQGLFLEGLLEHIEATGVGQIHAHVAQGFHGFAGGLTTCNRGVKTIL